MRFHSTESCILLLLATIEAKSFDASSLHERSKQAKTQLPDDGSGDVEVRITIVIVINVNRDGDLLIGSGPIKPELRPAP